MRPLLLWMTIALLFVPASWVSAGSPSSGTASETIEMMGDWTITENTTISNRTVVLQGNLFVNEGALTLVNSTLMMKCYADGQFRIDIKGELHLINSTLTANITENNYYLLLQKSGELMVENSVIEYAGYQDGERSGVYVLGDIETRNATFRYNYCPLWAKGLKDRELRDMNIYGNSWGIRLVSCENITLKNISISRNYRTGIWMEGGSENRVEGNEIHAIYRPSSSSRAQGIIIENETSDVVKGNHVERTSREGILITGETGERNIVENNTLVTNGLGAIHLRNTASNTVSGNHLNSSHMGILIENSEHNILKDNEIETSVGVKLLNSDFNTIILGELKNIKSYGIMMYSSNRTVISGITFTNTTTNLYLRDSVAIFAGHIYSDKYRIYGDSKLYLCLWVKAIVVNYRGEPMNGVPLKLRFMGSEISEGTTYGTGIRGFLAPYAVHTPHGKNYSWCEMEAVYNASFIENPIRFYSWEKKEVLFREKPPGLDILLAADKKEVKPGDTVNLTINVWNRSSPVDNASIDITIGDKPVFPPRRTGNGTYSASIRIPDFENSIRLVVKASLRNQTGNASLTLMRPSVEYKENPPSSSENAEWLSPYAVYVLALLLFFSVMFFTKGKKPVKRSYSSLKPIARDGIEIEK